MTTPQNPYQTPPQDGQAAPQNPYAAPNATVPPQQGYAAPPAAGFPAPPAPAKSGRAGRFGKILGIRLIVSIVAFVVIGGGYAIYDQMTHGADTAKAGDCVVNKGDDTSPDVHVISCSDPSAKFKVLQVISGTDTNACQSVPGTTAEYYQSGGHTDDVVLCLGDNK